MKDIIKSPDERERMGLKHHHKTLELYKHIETIDFENGDYLELDNGLSDNGERLQYILDSFFEKKDLENKINNIPLLR